MLVVERAIITIDAMGCQRDIAQQIIDKKADYVSGLKGNQGTLREDAELFVTEQRTKNFADTTITRAVTIDADNGRIETCTTAVIHDVGWIQERHDWPGLNAIAIAIVESTRETNGVIEKDAALHHLTGHAGASSRPGHSKSLGDREQPALGHGHGVPRRRVQGQNQPRANKFHHHKAYGLQFAPMADE
jgi:hypothetical protein